MIGRVTQGNMINGFNASIRERQNEMQKVQNSLSTGYRINLPSDDPVGTINFMDYHSRLKEIGVYQNNIANVSSKLKTIDGNLDSVTAVMQRLREIAVQGANGLYTKEDREKMAVEVDSLLRELVSVANSYYKGDALFGGTMIDEAPFKVNLQVDPKSGIEFLQDVRYIGNNQAHIMEVDRGVRVNTTQPGNQIFWADNMQIYSTQDVAGYVAPVDSKISIDGITIEIKQGDNLEVIADKINRSGAAVIAGVETQNGASFFTLQSTSPHQISLMDMGGGTTLQDMGVIDNGMLPPNNYSPSARVFTGSIFEVMIDFRKALQADDIYKIGGTALIGMDNSIANVLKFRANLGAISERLDFLNNRLSHEAVYMTEAKDNAVGTDISKAITELKMLEFSHDVALNVGARLLPKTLLDFLR